MKQYTITYQNNLNKKNNSVKLSQVFKYPEEEEKSATYVKQNI